MNAKIAALFPRTDDDPVLHPWVGAERISNCFSNSTFDWEWANRKRKLELERLELMKAPDLVISGHKNLFDKTCDVEVRAAANSDCAVRFAAYMDSSLDGESIAAPRAALDDTLRNLISELAECLGYDYEFAG